MKFPKKNEEKKNKSWYGFLPREQRITKQSIFNGEISQQEQIYCANHINEIK